MSTKIITLTTDFGTADNYVGAMKGAILAVNPQATIVDITHGVAPRAILQGVYLASTSWPYFPRKTIHVAVVDPGVGSDRQAIVLQTPMGFFVGPDNGLLSAGLPGELRPEEAATVALTPPFRAFALTNPRFFNETVSNTFHGRDIFGPVAAHLAAGVSPAHLGAPIDEIVALPFTRARRANGGVLGEVQHVDVYGNLITNVRADMLQRERLVLEVKRARVKGLGRFYAEQRDIFALVTSDGWLAAALPNGSAAARLDVGVGEPVSVSFE